MVLGLLLTAIVSGTVVSVALFAASSPIWLVLIAYPVVGTLVMLFGLAIISLWNRVRPSVAPPPTHFPVQRNTTPTVATNNLTSVANDNLRS